MQDEASLSPAATRAGFSMALRPQVGNVNSSHRVAATIRPPEVRMRLQSHASGSLGMIARTSPRGKGPFRGNTHVCGIPVRSEVRKDVQTVPRRIKLSRAGMPFSKP